MRSCSGIIQRRMFVCKCDPQPQSNHVDLNPSKSRRYLCLCPGGGGGPYAVLCSQVYAQVATDHGERFFVCKCGFTGPGSAEGKRWISPSSSTTTPLADSWLIAGGRSGGMISSDKLLFCFKPSTDDDITMQRR